MRASNKPNGRPTKGRKPKGKETRKAVTFRLQPSTIDTIRQCAADRGISQSDLIEELALLLVMQ